MCSLQLPLESLNPVLRLFERYPFHSVSWYENPDAGASTFIGEHGLPMAAYFHLEGLTKNSQDILSKLQHELSLAANFLNIEPLILDIKPARLDHNYAPVMEHTVGKFWIGSHLNWQDKPLYHPIFIDETRAFGSGEHPTTQGCLEALTALQYHQPYLSKILDMGCGSGILSFGARRIWPSALIVAADCDPDSVAITKRHARLQKTLGKTKVYKAQSVNEKCISQYKDYDLVIANILASPLEIFAKSIKAILKNGGHIILSGFLTWQENRILHAYQAQNIFLIKRIVKDNWVSLTLTFQKSKQSLSENLGTTKTNR